MTQSGYAPSGWYSTGSRREVKLEKPEELSLAGMEENLLADGGRLLSRKSLGMMVLGISRVGVVLLVSPARTFAPCANE